MQLATDPPVSEKQRRAMFAAAAGRSTLGIPKKVGEEFVGQDASYHHVAGSKAKKDGEPASANPYPKGSDPARMWLEGYNRGISSDSSVNKAAGVIFLTPSGHVLYLKRSDKGDHAGEWAFPGGRIETDEQPIDTARREAKEEIGVLPHKTGMIPFDQRISDEGVDFTTFVQGVDDQFEVNLNDEHVEARWFPIDAPPSPLHPGVKAMLSANDQAQDFLSERGFVARLFGPNDKMLAASPLLISRNGAQRWLEEQKSKLRNAGESVLRNEISESFVDPARMRDEALDETVIDWEKAKAAATADDVIWTSEKLSTKDDATLRNIGKYLGVKPAPRDAMIAAIIKASESYDKGKAAHDSSEEEWYRSIEHDRDRQSSARSNEQLIDAIRSLMRQPPSQQSQSQIYGEEPFEGGEGEGAQDAKPAMEMTVAEIKAELATAKPNGYGLVGGKVRYDALKSALAHKAMTGDDAPKTLYINRPLTNADDFIMWARQQGFTETLTPDDLHVTLAFSKTPLDWSEIPDSFDTLESANGDNRSVEKLGDEGAIVLKFEFPEFQRRFEELQEAGASWDYESFQPHITITYTDDGLDLSTITPYAGVLEFGPERYAEVKLKTAEDEAIAEDSASLAQYKWLRSYVDHGSWSDAPSGQTKLIMLDKGWIEENKKGTPNAEASKGEFVRITPEGLAEYQAYRRKHLIDGAIAQDSEFSNLEAWSREVLAKYPKAKIQQERLNDGYAKVAFVGNKVVGKFTMGGTKSRRDGWIAKDCDITADTALAFDREILAKVPADLRVKFRQRSAFAFDKGSVRTYDADGRLHVETTPISKANICPYLGREIPDFETLGLQPDKIYNLLRDPEELEKAAPTFNGIQVLKRHVPVSADDHQPYDIVGATGTDAEFVKPYLKNSLVVWTSDAIGDINDETKKELSSAYRYRADMTPGSYEGERYDGVMRDIIGNHVALVEEGRAGSDVVVGDSKEELNMSKKVILTRKAAAAQGAIQVFLRPKLAQDAKVDLTSVLASITGKNFKAKKPDIFAGVKKLTVGKLAKDASMEGLIELLDAVDTLDPVEAGTMDALETDPNSGMPMAVKGEDDASPDADIHAKIKAFLAGKISDEDMAQVDALISSENGATDEPADNQEMAERIKAEKERLEKKGAKDEPPEFKGKPELVTKDAMNKTVKEAVQQAQDAAQDAIKLARDENNKARDAERFVRPWVGDLAMAHDSAEAVFRTALTALNVDITGVPASAGAYKAILEHVPVPGKGRKEALAMDSTSGAEDFNKRFPGAARIKVV